MGNICEHQFEIADKQNPKYSMTEYDLYARTQLSIRKNLESGEYEIFHIRTKKVVFRGDLNDVVREANRIEKAENTIIGCQGLCPKRRIAN